MRVQMILLDGSSVAGIGADLVQVDGSVFLQNGFISTGPVRFYGGRIEGDLDCRGRYRPALGPGLFERQYPWRSDAL